MRSIAILLGLVAAVASAQQPTTPWAPTPPPAAAAPSEPALPPPPLPPPTEPAPSQPPPPSSSPSNPSPSAPAPAPAATGPAEPASERLVRYSRFSAGPGGPLLAFTQVISGLVSGGLLGDTYDEEGSEDQDRESNAYTGAMIGGLTLGTVSTIYQYFVPVERNESLLVSGAASTGFLAGLALAASSDISPRSRVLLSFATTQVGVISVLAFTHGGKDVSTGDAALVGMTSLYAFTLTGLTQLLFDMESSTETHYTPTLMAPAIGMALGGLLALPLEVETSRIVKLTLIPIGVGLSMLWLGATLADGPTVPLTAMAGMATSFALTLLLTSDPGVPTEKEGFRRADFHAVPVPVVMAAGRDNSSLAAGPGLLMSF